MQKWQVTDELIEKLLSSFVCVNDCWVWVGAKTTAGYGRLVVAPRITDYTHRASYRLFIRDIEPKMTIDHLCRNRACINPDHLEQVSNRENIIRGESATAKNLRRKDCVNGHPLSGDNLYTRPNPRGMSDRDCKTCKREAFKRFKQRQLA